MCSMYWFEQVGKPQPVPDAGAGSEESTAGNSHALTGRALQAASLEQLHSDPLFNPNTKYNTFPLVLNNTVQILQL